MKKLNIIIYSLTALCCIGFLTACVVNKDTNTPSISLDNELYDNNISFTETLNFYQNKKLYGVSGDKFYFHLNDKNQLDISKEESNSLFHFTLSDTYTAETNTLKISSLILDKNYNYFSLTGSGLAQSNQKIDYTSSNVIGSNYFESGASFTPSSYVLHFTYLDGKIINPVNISYTNYKFNFYQVLVEESKGNTVIFHLTKDNKLETCHCYHNEDSLFYIVLSEDFNKTTSSSLKIKSFVLNKNFDFFLLKGTSGIIGPIANVETNTKVINSETMYYPSTYTIHFSYKK